jgi:hemolysin activation/secretion protein
MPDAKLGEAILDIDVSRARSYQVMLSIDNYRPPSVGSNQLGVGGWVRNLTGQGDVLEVKALLPMSGQSGENIGVTWHMPLGYYGTHFSVAIDQGRSAVTEEPMNVLDIRSSMDSRDIGISQSLVETLAQTATVGLNRVNRSNKTWLLGAPFSFSPGEPSGVTKESLWRFWQEYTLRSSVDVFALRSTFTHGKNNLHDIVGLPATTIPERKYHTWLMQAQYAHHVFDNGAQVILRGAWQQTNNHLSPLDGMSIGGVDTVRGYRENQLIRDNGATLNVEFEYPVIRKGGREFNLTVTPFYDYGRGHNRSEAAEMISSCGLSFKARWDSVEANIALAKRLATSANIGSGTALQDRGVHFQLSYIY